MKQRAKIVISWNLDMVPGWNDNPDDVKRKIEQFIKCRFDDIEINLIQSIPHYKPRIDVIVENE